MITRMELNHIIENILNDLPEMYRIVFALRELNQHSVEESARLLGISETNVKVRLLRAKNMIRRKLNPHTIQIPSIHSLKRIAIEWWTGS